MINHKVKCANFEIANNKQITLNSWPLPARKMKFMQLKFQLNSKKLQQVTWNKFNL